MLEAHEKQMLRVLGRKLAGHPDAIPVCGDLPIWDIQSVNWTFERHLFRFILSEIDELEVYNHLVHDHPYWRNTVSGGTILPNDIDFDYFMEIVHDGAGLIITKRDNTDLSELVSIVHDAPCESYEELTQSNVYLNISAWFDNQPLHVFIHPDVV